MRALLAGLTRLTLYGLVSYSCLSVTRWLGQTSFRRLVTRAFKFELHASNHCHVPHGFRARSRFAGPLH